MKQEIPRIVLAGTDSGCGKTAVTCALLKALINKGLKVSAFKCGPDYIDPMFHKKVIGARSSNLDLFLFNKNTLKYLLAKNSENYDISVIEGMMGLYDGIGMSFKTSTHEISITTKSPVILIINAGGAALSLMAKIKGFTDFTEKNQICGVILNKINPATYNMLGLEKEILKQFKGKVIPLGCLPYIKDSSIESRHLGLVTANEISDLKEKVEALAEQTAKTIDLEAVIKIAKSAPSLSFDSISFPRNPEGVRIAVARDNAFCFYYEDSLDILEEMGAELIPFSPLNDRFLPENINGLYLGGGYPELYAKELSENKSMLGSIREALENNLPCIAECGGFMYLLEFIDRFPMVGYLPGKCYDTKKLSRFGYVTLTSNSSSMLCKKGEKITGHEFHYWDCEYPGSSFTAVKDSGRGWSCVHSSDTLYAGYPHFHFYSNPDFAVNFYKSCLKEKEND